MKEWCCFENKFVVWIHLCVRGFPREKSSDYKQPEIRTAQIFVIPSASSFACHLLYWWIVFDSSAVPKGMTYGTEEKERMQSEKIDQDFFFFWFWWYLFARESVKILGLAHYCMYELRQWTRLKVPCLQSC